MRRPTLCVLAFVSLVSIGVAAVDADTVFITNSGSGGIVFDAHEGAGSNTIGWQFTVGSAPLQLTKLGFFDYQSDGLESPVEVGVWNTATKALLASAIIPAGTAGSLADGFRFTALGTPVTLLSKTNYTIAEELTAAGELRDGRDMAGQTFSAGAIVTNGGVRGGFQYFGTDFASQMPDQTLGDSTTSPYTGPNFQFNVIAAPLPATAWAGLALLGGVGLVLLARRRRIVAD